jgi:hypothetical protein
MWWLRGMGAATLPPSFSDKPATCLVVGAIFVQQGTKTECENKKNKKNVRTTENVSAFFRLKKRLFGEQQKPTKGDLRFFV